mmetsp:Transcript_9484/g.27324  ORF Transcript_9484/g.27324 Transcript_9484/m.27324 type:complete len:145 (+) Transcript_9484:459-893(+)
MNEAQRAVYDAIIAEALPITTATAADESRSKVFFIDSEGGGGKTFLLETVIAAVREESKVAIACATTGVAALLLEGGTTAHSRFGVPVPAEQKSISDIVKESARAQVIKEAAVIVWDEITQAHKYVVNTVDKFLRDLMNQKDAS